MNFRNFIYRAITTTNTGKPPWARAIYATAPPWWCHTQLPLNIHPSLLCGDLRTALETQIGINVFNDGHKFIFSLFFYIYMLAKCLHH